MTMLTLTDGSQVELVYPVDRPAVPGLNCLGLSHVRDDLLGSAARAEAQAEQAMADGNLGLAQRCGGEADALRRAAHQLVSYALVPTWSVEPPAAPLPTIRPAAVTA